MATGNFLTTQGTQTAIPIDTVGTVSYPISKIDVGNIGSSIPWQGAVTVTSGTFVSGTAGTISVGTVNTGTINTGTINVGTIDSVSQLPPGYFQALATTSGTAVGTIKTLVSGSAIYITDLVINMGIIAGTVSIYNGGTNQAILGPLSLNANGGLVSNYRVPPSTTAGSALIYQQIGTAALMIAVTGFVK